MGVEKERKFLTKNDSWRGQVSVATRMVQGYLGRDEGFSVSVVADHGAKTAMLKSSKGCEEKICFVFPYDDACQILALVEKGRPVWSEKLEFSRLTKDDGIVSRIRSCPDTKKSFVTVKGRKDEKGAAPEFEISVDYVSREKIDELCGKWFVEKTRHVVEFGGGTWEVDVFEGKLSGLVMAEREAHGAEDLSSVAIPDWAGIEVTSDSRYSNVALCEAGRVPEIGSVGVCLQKPKFV